MSTSIDSPRSESIEIRLTPSELSQIKRVANSTGTGLDDFVRKMLASYVRHFLADQAEFILNAEGARAWEEIVDQPAQELPGLRSLLARPSPFVDG